MKNPLKDANELFGEEVDTDYEDLGIDIENKKKEVSIFRKLKGKGESLSRIISEMDLLSGDKIEIFYYSKRYTKVGATVNKLECEECYYDYYSFHKGKEDLHYYKKAIPENLKGDITFEAIKDIEILEKAEDNNLSQKFINTKSKSHINNKPKKGFKPSPASSYSLGIGFSR